MGNINKSDVTALLVREDLLNFENFINNNNENNIE